MEEVSVINFVVKDLNNKRNLIGQNGLKSLDKMERRGIKGEKKKREREVCRELRERKRSV